MGRIMKELSKINEFFAQNRKVPAVNQYAVDGPNVLKNMLAAEINKVNKLDVAINSLIDYLLNPKYLKYLPEKEKESRLKTAVAIQSNSRDFITRVAELSSKNALMQEVLRMSTKKSEVILSESGETYRSHITDEERKQVTEILRNIINDRTRG